MAYLSINNLEKLITGEKRIFTNGKWKTVLDLDPLYKLMQELNMWAMFYKEKGKISSPETETECYEQYRIMNNKSTVVYNYIQSQLKPNNNDRN